MSNRMEQVRDLLVTELRERGDADDQDHIGEFCVLLGVHRIDENGHLGWVHTLLSDDGVSPHVVMGLMEHKRMQMQAMVVNVLRDTDED